jgi:carbonic anhydrase
MAALITLVAPEVERNAVRSATTIANRSDIVKNALAGGRLSIVPAVYELETGEVRRLP